MSNTILDFKKYKLDIQRALSGDPMETSEEIVHLFLKIKLLTPEQLADPEFKLLKIQLIKRISGYQYPNGESVLSLILQELALELHQMNALENIDPKYQEQASAHEIFNILGQLKEHQTDILRVTGIPQETNIIEYMSALHELKKYQTDIWWIFGFPEKMTPIEYFNLLKDLDKNKTTILKNIPQKKIQQDIELPAIIRALHNMQVIEKDDGKTTLHFEGDIDSNIIQIITDTLYKMSSVKPENRLKIVAINKKYEQIDTLGECEIKNLSQRCKYILSKHPDCYIKITGNLDAKKLQKNCFDFSYLKHIIVDGDFICFKNNKFFPHKINGTLDCQGFTKGDINQNTIFPQYAPKINFGHSITGLNVLIGILPKDIQTIIVEPAMIRENSQYFDAAEELTKKYPGLTIIDTKGNVFGQEKKVKKTEQTKKSEPVPVKQQVLEQKIPGEHMEIKDIIVYCKEKKDFDKFSEQELKRLIRQVLSNQHKNNIEKKMMKLADETPVVCIDASQINLVHQEILNIVQESNERKALKNKPNNNSVKPKQTNKQTIEQTVREPINITKYISYELYKDIETSSPHKINSVLHDISEINLDPTDPKMQDQSRIHIIKDNKETVSTNVKKEGGACLVQNVDSSIKTDKKRIVWAVANGPDGELIIVGIGFCDDHNSNKKNKRNTYRDLRQKAFKKQTYTKEELTRYINIEHLLKGIKNNVLTKTTIKFMQKAH